MHNAEISESLKIFNPVGLDAINCVKLMNRCEMKYVFHLNKLNDLFTLLNGKYNILENNNLRVFPYHTTYLDTSDNLFYHQHARGELERHKIRYRKYESTGESFLEIKKKTNKYSTIKWRIPNIYVPGLFDNNAVDFLNERLPDNSLLINPALINRFTRVTLISFEPKERITIDYNISYTDPVTGKKSELPFLAIVELKKEGWSNFSPFSAIIKQLGIRPSGFSKYCIGASFFNDSLKKNMLKPKLLLLNKIENEYIKSSYN